MRLTPDEKQEQVIQALLSGETQGAALIGARMGAGKTLVATEYVRRSKAQVVIIIGPLNTRLGWKRTLENQGVTLPFVSLTSTETEGYGLLMKATPGVYFIGYDFLVASRKPTRLREAWKWHLAGKRADVVIADECHGFSNRKSERYNTVKHIKPKVMRIGMSGTWFGNKFEGAWAVTRWLWPSLIPRGFWNWVEDWSSVIQEEIYVGGEEETITYAGPERNPGAFAESLPGYFYWTRDVGVELLPPKVLYVDMTPKQRRIYDSMEDDLLAWIDGNPLVASLPVSKTIRLRQIALGTPVVEWDEDEPEVYFKDDCESPKLDALVEFAKEHDGTMLVYLDSKVFSRVVVKRLRAKFPRERVELWNGDTPQNERESIKEAFLTGDVKFLVATIQSIGTGTDGLQDACNTVVWLNKCTNAILNEQAEARLYRPGQTSDVVTVEIRSAGTVDDEDNSRLLRVVRDRELSMGDENVE